MLNRLGMWNRLALVAGTLFSVGSPTWIVWHDHQKAAKLSRTGFDACMANQNFVATNDRSQSAYCWDFWYVKFKPLTPNLDDWGIMVTGCAVAALILYGIVWGTIATAKWVWRGREAGKEPSPVRTTPLGNETD